MEPHSSLPLSFLSGCFGTLEPLSLRSASGRWNLAWPWYLATLGSVYGTLVTWIFVTCRPERTVFSLVKDSNLILTIPLWSHIRLLNFGRKFVEKMDHFSLSRFSSILKVTYINHQLSSKRKLSHQNFFNKHNIENIHTVYGERPKNPMFYKKVNYRVRRRQADQ